MIHYSDRQAAFKLRPATPDRHKLWDEFYRQFVTPELTRFVVASLGEGAIRGMFVNGTRVIPLVQWDLMHTMLRQMLNEPFKETGTPPGYPQTYGVARMAAIDWCNDTAHVHEVKP